MKRPSTITTLPEDILSRLQELLRDPRVTQLAATRKINEILIAEGQPPVSKSAVNRYSMRMDNFGKKFRESREITKMWLEKFGSHPEGEVGKLLNEMVRTLAFDLTLEMADGETPVEPKMLKELSIAIRNLERASSENVKREAEIRKRVLAEAADTVEETAKQQGLSADQAAFWREKVLGVK